MKAQSILFTLRKRISRFSFLKRNLLFLCFILSQILAFSVSATAQRFWIKTYSEQDGLANSRVYDLAQDTLGQIWFATRSGISVYDGFQWKKYSVAEGLPAISYSQIEIDEKGRVWVMPEYSTLRISFFDGKSWSTLIPLKITDFTNANIMKVSCIDSNFCVAIGSWNQGLTIYQNEKWHLLSVEDGLPSNNIYGLESWRSYFFVATDKGLCLVRNLQANDKFAANLDLPSQQILGIFIENKEETRLDRLKIWLIGKDWVGFIQNNKFSLVSKKIHTFIDDISRNLRLIYDGFRGIYYGNMKFLSFLDIKKQTNQLIGEKNGLISEGVIGLICDREKNIWVASLRGVSKIASLRFANYTKEEGLLEDEVTAIAPIGEKYLVFGHNQGLTFFNGSRTKTIAFRMDSILSETMGRVLDLAVDRKKNVWAACSYFGIVKARLDSGIVLHLPGSVFPAPVNSVVINRKGQIYFACGNMLCRLNPDAASFKVVGKFKDTNVRKLCLLPDDSIALLTKGKSVILYRKGLFFPLTSNHKQIDNVYSFMVESDSSFLFGTVHGLFRAEGQNFKRVYFGKKVINRPIFSLLKDPLGRIWLGSDNGVFRWDGFDLRHYTAKNGFVGQETNRSAVYVDAQGHIWFGADRGVSCFREEYDFQFDKIPPPRVEILEASANEIIFAPFKNSSLAYNDNNLQFRFRTISFIDERDNYFRYKLEGYEETWSEPFISKDHLIRFTNLPHGQYRFYLQARNALGMWSDIVSSGLITINQPFWMKWWFYLILSSIVAMSVVGTTIIFYQRSYSKHLEKEVERRTAELADSERQYHLTIDSLKDAIHVVDENFRIKLCNQRAIERNKNLALDTDIVGKNIFEAFPFLSKKIKKEYELVFRNGKMLETERKHTVNGVTFITEVRKIPIFEKDRVASVLTVIHDATERRIAEKEKQKAQALLEAAIEQTTAGIIIMDAPEFRIKLVNSAACEILDIKDLQNVDWQKALGAKKWQMISEESEEDELVGLDLIQLAKNGKSLENQITILQSEAGKSKWMYVNVAPVRDEQGKIIASVIVFQDITDIKQAEKQIKDSLKEKNVLLQEIHHRVKNNLQVVSSLLFLQSKKVSDKQAQRMFQNSRDRIKSIALVHEKMYRSTNFAQVNFADYVRSISHSLYQVHHVNPDKVDFSLDLDEVPLSIELAIPCGLIVNELVSNALKYAFSNSMKKQKKIEIKIKAKENDIVELSVCDNGRGLPKEIDFDKIESLGLKLVATLARDQLDGELKISRRHGTKFIVRFKTK